MTPETSPGTGRTGAGPTAKEAAAERTAGPRFVKEVWRPPTGEDAWPSEETEETTWWHAIVPGGVVAALDACASTGSGPDAALAEAGALASRRGARGLDCETIMTKGGPLMTPGAAFAAFVRDRYGWAVPAGATLDAIAAHHPGGSIKEIGSGSGYVAACLRARGLAVTAVNRPGCGWGAWWEERFIADFTEAHVEDLDYAETDAFLMLMPDRDDAAGGDMMAEALYRMPLGAVLWVCAPPDIAGSGRGREMLVEHFAWEARFEMLDCMPPVDDSGWWRWPLDETRVEGCHRLRKTSQPDAMPAPRERRQDYGPLGPPGRGEGRRLQTWDEAVDGLMARIAAKTDG